VQSVLHDQIGRHHLELSFERFGAAADAIIDNLDLIRWRTAGPASEGGFNKRDFEAGMQGVLQSVERKNNPARYALERVMPLIQAFQTSIGDDVEVGISVVGSGSAAPFRLRAIKASNPGILIFDGVDDRGNLVLLLQHYSQMALMLVAIPKLEERPFRIGFTG
jgi:hypothetical protein